MVSTSVSSEGLAPGTWPLRPVLRVLYRSEQHPRPTSSNAGGACGIAASSRPQRWQHQRPARRVARAITHADPPVSKGFMTPDMRSITDLEGSKARRRGGTPRPSSRCTSRWTSHRPDVRAVVHAHPPTGNRLRGRRHPAGPRRARRGDHRRSAAYPSRSTPRRRPRNCRRRSASTSRRTTACCSPITALSRSALTCTPPTTGWKRLSTLPPSAWWQGCSGAST